MGKITSAIILKVEEFNKLNLVSSNKQDDNGTLIKNY